MHIERKVQVTCLELLMKNTGNSGVISVALALLLSLYLYDDNFYEMLLWSAVLALVVILRELLFYRRYRRQLNQDDFNFEMAHHTTVTFLFFAGCLWGLGSLLFLPNEQNTEVIATFFVVIIGITAGNIPGFAYSVNGFLAFMVPLMLMTAIKLLSLQFYALALMSVIFALFMVVLVKRISRVVLFAISTDVENARLLFEVTAEKEKAEQANFEKSLLLDEKNDLIANISHEFRTPLTLILGPVSHLISQAKSAKESRELKMVSHNAQRLLRMVDQLLTLARLDHRMHEQQSIPSTNMSALLTDTLTALQPLIDEQNINLDTDITPDLSILLNHDDAEKIAVNLLSNAIKYCGQGKYIKVTIKRLGDKVQFQVEDHGIGMAPEQLHQIFKRFSRLDTPYHKGIAGAGIGLAMVKELVEHYQGDIRVSSEPDKGSCFSLLFDVHLGASQVVNQQSRYSQQEVDYLLQQTDEQQSTDVIKTEKEGSFRLLIIEDNADMRQYIAQCFDDDYEILFAVDGDEGVEQARRYTPDIIITDLMMPKCSGFEVAKVLRDDEKTSHIPLLMLTAKADQSSRLHAWQLDIDEYIEKPFVREELKLRVRNLLNIRQMAGRRLAQTVCQPQQPLHGLSEKDQLFIKGLNEYIEQHFSEPALAAKDISAHLSMSERQLSRKIKALIDHSVPEYIRLLRLNEGAKLLKLGKQVTQAALTVGFTSQAYFSRCFKAQYGVSPSHFQSNPH